MVSTSTEGLSPPPAETQRGVVKAILSGDSFTLRSSLPQAVPTTNDDKIVSLAFVTSPRIASNKRGTEDEPFAFEARETLRRSLVGKEIAIRIEYSVQSRDFCTVYVRSPKSKEWVNVAILNLQRGFSKLRDENPRGDPPVDWEYLVEAQRLAKDSEIGIWKSPMVRQIP
jgi:staphylococcal nuclease domain-containing protein 1